MRLSLVSRIVAIALATAAMVYVAPSQEVRAQQPPEFAPVRRDAIKLGATGAQAVLVAAVKEAETMKLHVNISVVDDGGHLIAFLRMDGARPGSIYTSQTKAATAALMRGKTGPLPNAESPDIHLSLALENAAAASGGKFTSLKGGVPLIVDGQVVGAVGVGGATGDQDRQIAEAGAEALVRMVLEKRQNPD